jgi:hypothetical protein
MRYFLITYYRKPNGQIDESAEVSKNIKVKDIQMCNVILDFKERKVEKCVIEGNRVDTDWGRLHAYYKEVYPNIIEQLEKSNQSNT